MIKIWTKCERFSSTNQRFADQSRTIMKKGGFSDLKILEIYQQINRETYNQQNQEKIRTPEEKKTCKYLGILETDTIKQAEVKEEIQKEFLRRPRKTLETKQYCRNLIRDKHLGGLPCKILGTIL